MPIFEFKCSECKEIFEVLLFNSRETIKCKNCESEKVLRILSPISFKSGDNFNSTAAQGSCDNCSATSCSTCHR
ncbi:MAG: FmdB family zinc ribbon protein [Thermodesulfobacteriota bacterium]|nr:FmdB family zinc ribbon protein [Thermodesulfobacteriota bacterium]